MACIKCPQKLVPTIHASDSEFTYAKLQGTTSICRKILMLGSKKQGASHQNAFDGRANSNRDQGLSQESSGNQEGVWGNEWRYKHYYVGTKAGVLNIALLDEQQSTDTTTVRYRCVCYICGSQKATVEKGSVPMLEIP
jgi:hypothetical protein